MAGTVSLGPVLLAAFMLAGLCPQLRWECVGPTAGWGGFTQQGVSHISLAPQTGLKLTQG